MTSLFDKELTEMEREVLELKTIHRRGLGTTRFYSADIEKNHDIFTDITVQIADGEPTPAIVTIAANIPTPINFPMIVFTPQNNGYLFDILGGASGTAKVKAMSTSQIGSIQ